MRFELSEDQALLQHTARQLVVDIFGDSAARDALEGKGSSGEDAGWRTLVDLGLVGLLVPEAHGGSGGTVVDACIVAECLATVCAPVPFVGCSVAAASFLRHCGGSGDLLNAIANGTNVVVAIDADLSWPAKRHVVGWDWTPSARWIDVGVDGPVELDSSGVASMADSIDPMHRIAMLADVAPMDNGVHPGSPLALAATRVALAASALGLAQRALDVATDYAGHRIQYGQPIGSFQAVQHLCADMLFDVETSRSVVYGAAWTVEHDPSAASRTAAAALCWSGSAARRVCETSIQVLGGIGVTWEHDAHLRLRAAHSCASAFGGVRTAALSLADEKFATLEGH